MLLLMMFNFVPAAGDAVFTHLSFFTNISKSIQDTAKVHIVQIVHIVQKYNICTKVHIGRMLVKHCTNSNSNIHCKALSYLWY